METNTTTVALDATANNEDKNVSVEILQDGFSYSLSLKAPKDRFNKGDKTLSNDICRQICGSLYNLMLIRKQSGQKIGISFSKDFSFGFTYGSKVIRTFDCQQKLKLKLKIGYKSDSRKRFEKVLTLIIEQVLRGNNLYTIAEIEQLNTSLDNEVEAEKAAKVLKDIANKAATVKA